MTPACHIIHLVWSSESLLCLLLICVFNTDEKNNKKKNTFILRHSTLQLTIQKLSKNSDFLNPCGHCGQHRSRTSQLSGGPSCLVLLSLTSTVTDACNAWSFFILHSIHFLTCWIKHKKCCFKHLFLSFSLSFLLSFFLSSTYQESPIYMEPRSEK